MKKIKLWLPIITGLLLTAFYGCKDEDVEKVGVCPIVISTTPGTLEGNVQSDRVVTITFNVPLNPATITPEVFTLVGTGAFEGGRFKLNEIQGSLTYDSEKAMIIFTPNEDLNISSTYTGTVKTMIRDLMGNALQTPYIWSFTTGNVAPAVISVDPDDKATDVFLNKKVIANFNVPMDATSIDETTFTLQAGSTAISGTVSYINSTATFSPSVDLLPNTEYTATITTGAKDMDGITMLGNYVWTFTTGSSLAPTITLTDPEDQAVDVALNKVLSVNFSENMNSTSVLTSFTLKENNNVISGTVDYSGTTATFTPAANLVSGTTYTATVSNGAQNLSGTPMANDYVWTFTTGTFVAPTIISTDPENLENEVALNKVVSVEFSESMNSSTVLSSFKLMEGANVVSGTVNYVGTTATFTPDVNLLSSATYTATVTKDAQNLSGMSLAVDYVWTFNTKATLGGPFVDLNTVGRFGIIAGVGVSNNAGFSKIRDLDVGISPGVRSSITGFPPAEIENGAMFASDDLAPPGTADMLTLAKQHLMDAYLFAEGATTPAPSSVSGDQGGLTLAPGIYKTASSLLIQNGDLTLDAQGDVNAVWIFQIGSDFTTVGGAGGNVILIGGAQAKNVFWQTGSSATIGDNTSFKGNVLALTSITMNSGATAVGRMLAINGSVVLTDTNIIDKP